MTDLPAQIDALDESIGNSSQLPAVQAQTRRAELARFRQNVAADISTPAPGSTSTVGGATITQRPDLAAQQAAAQGEPGYLPAKKPPLAKDGVPAGAGGSVQQPAPMHAAETAKIGIATR